MEKELGCFATLVVLALVLMIVLGTRSCSMIEIDKINAKSNLEMAYGRSQSMIILAQGQARIDTAQAQSLLMIAALPYLAAIVGVIVLGGIAMSVIGVFVLAIKNKPVHIERIETKIIYLPSPQASRREVWQMLSTGTNEKQVERHYYEHR